ncbi:MAG: hydrogenase [Planctomycetes bacterium]|nr:hydrogenase [Planctomycetota bacterium]
MVWLILAPLAAAAIAMAIPSNRFRPWILPAAASVQLALVARLVPHGDPRLFNRWLAVDPLSRPFLAIVGVVFFLCSLYAPSYLRIRAERPNRVLCACLLLFLAAMNLVALAHHLGLMWVAAETMTLVTIPSIYFNHNPRSLEAAWKTLVLGSVGIAMALLGSFFLAYAMLEGGSASTLLIDELVERPHTLSLPWLRAAFVLLVVGYGTKMGLAPMHTWKPDAYGEAPGMAGALLAGGMTSCAFLCVLRFVHIARIADDADYASRILLFFGLLSMATAAVYMAKQKDIKRCLAYSSVEHMGMLVFGLGIGGGAVAGALLHVIHNAVCKTGMFLAAGNIHRAYGSKSTDAVRGVLRRLPASGGLLLVGFFAITGSPLFGPFVSESMIVGGAFASGQLAAGLAFLALMLIVFLGMGNTLIHCALGPEPESANATRFRDRIPMVAPVAICMLLTFALGIHTPEFLRDWIDGAVAFLASGPAVP